MNNTVEISPIEIHNIPVHVRIYNDIRTYPYYYGNYTTQQYYGNYVTQQPQQNVSRETICDARIGGFQQEGNSPQYQQEGNATLYTLGYVINTEFYHDLPSYYEMI